MLLPGDQIINSQLVLERYHCFIQPGVTGEHCNKIIFSLMMFFHSKPIQMIKGGEKKHRYHHQCLQCWNTILWQEIDIRLCLFYSFTKRCYFNLAFIKYSNHVHPVLIMSGCIVKNSEVKSSWSCISLAFVAVLWVNI